MRISDWSSDVCASDLSSTDPNAPSEACATACAGTRAAATGSWEAICGSSSGHAAYTNGPDSQRNSMSPWRSGANAIDAPVPPSSRSSTRSEEHTSELQSLMRTSYAVFCLNKKNDKHPTQTNQSKVK